jgi:hypothetical protein
MMRALEEANKASADLAKASVPNEPIPNTAEE